MLVGVRGTGKADIPVTTRDQRNNRSTAHSKDKRVARNDVERARPIRGAAAPQRELLVFSKHVTRRPCVLLSPMGS